MEFLDPHLQRVIFSWQYQSARNLAVIRQCSKRWKKLVDEQASNVTLLRVFRTIRTPEYCSWWLPILDTTSLPEMELAHNFVLWQLLRNSYEDCVAPLPRNVVYHRVLWNRRRVMCMLRYAVFAAPADSMYSGQLIVLGFFARNWNSKSGYRAAVVQPNGEPACKTQSCGLLREHKRLAELFVVWIRKGKFNGQPGLFHHYPSLEAIEAAVEAWGNTQREEAIANPGG